MEALLDFELIERSSIINNFEARNITIIVTIFRKTKMLENMRIFVPEKVPGQRFVERGLASDGWSGRPSYYLSNGLPDNFTKRRQNGSKLGKRDKFVTHLR